MKQKLMLFVGIIAIAAMTAARGASAQEINDNIVDVLATDGRFDTAYQAVIAAGLADTLASADGTFTIFVPNDAAFSRLAAANPAALDFLLADPEGALSDVLLFHVVPGRYMGSDVAATDSLTPAQGDDLSVTVNADGEIFVNGAQVIAADIPAKNGVIHVINRVLVPRDLEIPTVATPVATQNLPTIAEALREDGRFTNLLGALEATGLAETFGATGDYTLFAPVDSAFEGVGDLRLTEEQLRSILLFHVVGDSLTRDQLATDDLVPTLSNGRPIFVNRNGSSILNLSGAQVSTFNIPASNGIIHVIDQIMMP